MKSLVENCYLDINSIQTVSLRYVMKYFRHFCCFWMQKLTLLKIETKFICSKMVYCSFNNEIRKGGTFHTEIMFIQDLIS